MSSITTRQVYLQKLYVDRSADVMDSNLTRSAAVEQPWLPPPPLPGDNDGRMVASHLSLSVSPFLVTVCWRCMTMDGVGLKCRPQYNVAASLTRRSACMVAQFDYLSPKSEPWSSTIYAARPDDPSLLADPGTQRLKAIPVQKPFHCPSGWRLCQAGVSLSCLQTTARFEACRMNALFAHHSPQESPLSNCSRMASASSGM